MKIAPLLILLSIFIINTSAFGELTQSDLQTLDKMFKDSEARMKNYIDLKIEALDNKLTGEIKTVREEIKTVREEIKTVREEIKTLDAKLTGEIKTVDGRVSMLFAFLIVLIALIAVAVGLPQYLLAQRGKEMQTYMEKIDALSREIETLKQQRIVGS